MKSKKEEALKLLSGEFETYSNLVLKQLRLLETIFDMDSLSLIKEHFKEIKMQEKEINKFEVKVSERVINIIVLYSPVATELRELMSIYRVSLDIEKIGDLVVNIVRSLKKIDDELVYQNFNEKISDILIISINMAEKALLSLNNKDMDYAVWTIRNDDVVDELHSSFIKKIMKKRLPHVKNPDELKSFINLMNVVKYIERIADKATNIAEAAIYASMGKDVRHKNVNLDTMI
ncbi:PhoU domain-containing protein [Marinilabiliaceae bacterium ANBcel2]|nr:PhoU domain-containing protein [Marinilabiliaceae bacterium ANBcel2]